MGHEIERKFQVVDPPGWLEGCRASSIEQGYLAIGENGEEVRLRRIGSTPVLTVKRGHGEERVEQEVELADEQFGALWPLTEGRRIRKRRHYVENGPTIEVDVYLDGLEGLVTAEVEFPSVEEADAFDPPEWLADELTGDERFANQQLAISGAPDA